MKDKDLRKHNNQVQREMELERIRLENVRDRHEAKARAENMNR